MHFQVSRPVWLALSLGALLAMTGCGDGDDDAPISDSGSGNPLGGDGTGGDGTGGDGTGTEDTPHDFAVMLFNDDSDLQRVVGRAQFARIATADRQALVDFYTAAAPDRCAYQGAVDFLWLDPNSAGHSLNFIDAGEAVLIDSPAGSFLELPRTEREGQIIYETVADGSYLPVPNGLSWSVEGADFTAVSQVAIPDTRLAADFSPTTPAAIAFNTQFTWTPHAQENGTVLLELLGGNGAGIYCRVEDDGVFAIPADVWPAGFNVGNVSRVVTGYQTINVVETGDQTLVNVRVVY